MTLKEVREYFQTVHIEVAEAALELASSDVQARLEQKDKVVKRMAKARAGRGKGKKTLAKLAQQVDQPTNGSLTMADQEAQAQVAAADPAPVAKKPKTGIGGRPVSEVVS